MAGLDNEQLPIGAAHQLGQVLGRSERHNVVALGRHIEERAADLAQIDPFAADDLLAFDELILSQTVLSDFA